MRHASMRPSSLAASGVLARLVGAARLSHVDLTDLIGAWAFARLSGDGIGSIEFEEEPIGVTGPAAGAAILIVESIVEEAFRCSPARASLEIGVRRGTTGAAPTLVLTVAGAPLRREELATADTLASIAGIVLHCGGQASCMTIAMAFPQHHADHTVACTTAVSTRLAPFSRRFSRHVPA